MGGRKASRPSADHTDGRVVGRRDRTVALVPHGAAAEALHPETLADEAFQRADRDRRVDLAAPAGRLARGGTHPAADRGEGVGAAGDEVGVPVARSEEHTSELSHGSSSYAVFCLKKKNLALGVVVVHLGGWGWLRSANREWRRAEESADHGGSGHALPAGGGTAAIVAGADPTGGATGAGLVPASRALVPAGAKIGKAHAE